MSALAMRRKNVTMAMSPTTASQVALSTTGGQQNDPESSEPTAAKSGGTVDIRRIGDVGHLPSLRLLAWSSVRSGSEQTVMPGSSTSRLTRPRV